ncbi:DnaJ domain-containing protein [Halobiforma haloterrestris]|uniref:DnaJ domain-containing protein n=2 Tax=Natronobacterium haloterrestre TaxID=148448 RepID=A0A1I1IK76_NATHA|nr:DnaJ domain-containing protein [Halobiforma haloterrestris]
MPGGERVTCCPECAEHARAVRDRAGDRSASSDSARTRSGSRTRSTATSPGSGGSEPQAGDSSNAGRTGSSSARSGSSTRVTESTGNSSIDHQRATCDGCAQSVPETDLETLMVTDGTTLSCCRSCAIEAAKRDDVFRPGGVDRDSGSGPDSSTRTETGTTTDTAGGSSSRSDSSDDDGIDGGGSLPTDDRDYDRDRNRCTQCRDAVAVERYRVTTIDGRTEWLCPACKAEAEEDGILESVAMRTTRAREVLGVGDDATLEEIHEAYRVQVKRAHPDRRSGSRSAFQLVTDAYERLREAEDDA